MYLQQKWSYCEPLGDKRMKVPKTILKHSFKEGASDLPLLLINNRFIMHPQNGQSLIDFISLHGTEQLADSLTLMHDWILYDSNLTIDQHKKDVLHDVKLLATQLRKLKDKTPKKKAKKLLKKLLHQLKND